MVDRENRYIQKFEKTELYFLDGLASVAAVNSAEAKSPNPTNAQARWVAGASRQLSWRHRRGSRTRRLKPRESGYPRGRPCSRCTHTPPGRSWSTEPAIR